MCDIFSLFELLLFQSDPFYRESCKFTYNLPQVKEEMTTFVGVQDYVLQH